MKQCRSDGVQAGAISDVGAGVAQHGDDAVRDRTPLAGQVVAETVRRLHKRWQHDRLVRQLHCTEHLVYKKTNTLIQVSL